MSEKNLLKISEVAEEAKVLSSTIRHYTDLGLLKVAGMTDGGHRLYDRVETLDLIAKIQALTKRGLTLPAIKEVLEGKSKIKKVLIIDDELEVGDFMVELLELKFPNWQVKLVTDGFQAGRILSEYYPDLVILDLMLPGVDGFKVCEMIKKDPLLKGIFILAITGYDSPEMKGKIMRSGANDYLAKPMDQIDLINKIKKLMGEEGPATPQSSPK